MKKTFISIAFVLGTLATFGQVKQTSNLNGYVTTFDFSNNYTSVKITGLTDKPIYCSSKVIEADGCLYFYLEDSETGGIYTICGDNSAAFTNGEIILEGYVVKTIEK